jgi:hypothetical protein
MREAIHLYTTREVSLGRAAELAGINYFVFEELLRKQGIPAIEPEITGQADRVFQQELADEILD